MMEFKLKTPTVSKSEAVYYQIQFSMQTVNEKYRDDVMNMILAALDGSVVGEKEQKPSALGFQKVEEDEDE